ncbi:uncharacterized protein LOC141856742 isoform X2 [Brevipalpus obovatus]|uniref:uncharacterized protein LOC141856742 isoform X2 n=1 Tax=Brevipalpus obovatus TaxID=246614 RepID=UPI003D9E9010
METKIRNAAPETELQRAVHCLKYAETSTLQLKNVYSFVLRLNDGLKSAILGLRTAIKNLRKVEHERDYWKLRFEALQNRDDDNWRLRYESLLQRNEQLEEELRKVYSNGFSGNDFQSRMDITPFIAQCRGEDDGEESSIEDDGESGVGRGGGERNFPEMIEGPPMSLPGDSNDDSAHDGSSAMQIKCEEDEDEEEEDQDQSQDADNEEMKNMLKNCEHTASENGADVDYEALRNCLAKDARQCPVCPRICSQRNSTVRHLIEVHHLDRSELMIRKFHKGYHFANFSK